MKLSRTLILLLIAVAALLVSVPAIASAQAAIAPTGFPEMLSIDGQKAAAGTVGRSFVRYNCGEEPATSSDAISYYRQVTMSLDAAPTYGWFAYHLTC